MQRLLAATATCLIACVLLAGAAAAESGGDHGILYTRESRTGTDVYLWKPGEPPYRLTWGPHDTGGRPIWSPNGRLVAYTAGNEPGYKNNPPGNCPDVDTCSPEIWVMRANGSHKRLLTAHDPAQYTGEPSWSPDSRRIVFVRNGGYPREELAIVSVRTGRERSLGVTGGDPTWGPHGIAFLGAGGVRLLDPATHRSRVIVHRSTDGLAWSPDGRRLASLSHRIMSLGIERPSKTIERVTVYSFTGRVLSSFRVRFKLSTQVCAVSWTPDGADLLVTRYNGRLYEVNTLGHDWRELPLQVAGNCRGIPSWR